MRFIYIMQFENSAAPLVPEIRAQDHKSQNKLTEYLNHQIRNTL